MRGSACSSLRADAAPRRARAPAQRLSVTLSDANFAADSLRYAAMPRAHAVDAEVPRHLLGWSVASTLDYTAFQREFAGEAGAPYAYARFSLPIQRHYAYHLTRFLMPLFLILAIAMTVFWIDPEDLGSQVGVGVTCLLAAIALQFAQASTLPEVDYLTLADRVYAACYVVIAGSVFQSILTNALQRKGRRDLALRLDRACRVAVPLLLAASIAYSAWVSTRPG